MPTELPSYGAGGNKPQAIRPSVDFDDILAGYGPDAAASVNDEADMASQSAGGTELAPASGTASEIGSEEGGKEGEPSTPAPATFSAPGRPEVGKGGDEPAPPLPPLARPAAEVATGHSALRASEVFTPAPAENPVVVALKRDDLYREALAPGRHSITCPWNDEHDDQPRGPTLYVEPSEEQPFGEFRCPHSHGDRLRIDLLLDQLEVPADAARCKPVIRVTEGEINRVGAAAEAVLSADGRHFRSGGRIVAVRRDDVTGDLGITALSNQSLVKALSKGATWQRFDGRSKKYVRCDPRPNVINFLMGAQTHDVLRPLAGLARQPYLRDDGSLVTEPGYDVASKVYADFTPADFPLPEPSEETARAALGELKHLLREFKFGGAGDEAAALSAILTAATRTSLPFAPAFNISASGSGSGKSYLANTIAPFAGPGVPTSLPYPTDEADASKKLLSLLLTKPAVAIFDDMQTDWLPFGSMNRMLTSETMADRLLGGNNTATVGTRCLFMGTGNNVRPLRDLARRVVTVYLSPRTSSPITIRYEGRPAEEVRRRRGHFVAAALTIVRGWQQAGRPRSDVPYIATYGDTWADCCRHPLIWLGEPDPAASLIDQVESDPDGEAMANLLQEWSRQFGSRAVMVRDLVQQANSSVMEALHDLPLSDRGGEINRDKLGWLLKKNANKVMRGLELRRTPTPNRTAWSVVPVEGGSPSSPASADPMQELVMGEDGELRPRRDSDGPVLFNGEWY